MSSREAALMTRAKIYEIDGRYSRRGKTKISTARARTGNLWAADSVTVRIRNWKTGVNVVSATRTFSTRQLTFVLNFFENVLVYWLLVLSTEFKEPALQNQFQASFRRSIEQSVLLETMYTVFRKSRNYVRRETKLKF